MNIKRGKIIITKIEGKVSIEKVEGLWNGKDRMTIARHLRKEMRKASYEILKAHKRADLEKQQKIEGLKNEVVVTKKVANKNIIEEKKQCPKTTKKKKLLMKAPKK